MKLLRKFPAPPAAPVPKSTKVQDKVLSQVV